MNYDALNQYLQTLLVDQAPSANYTVILPAAIQDAEERIYREMDFVACRTVQSPTAFTASNRDYVLPTSVNTILVLQGVSAITPVGAVPPAGTQRILEPVSLDFIDTNWPTESNTDIPVYWAMKDAKTITVAPTPNAAYQVRLTGIFRPTSMSQSNQTTYIGDIYPDLLIAACMVFLSGYQRDFGQQSDDPKLAMSWEALYSSRFKSAYEEEQRRKGSSVGWSPFQGTPLATPQRS